LIDPPQQLWSKTKVDFIIIETDSFSDGQIRKVESFVRAVADGIKDVNFETKRRIIDLLDVRGKLAIENEKKVVYVSCKLGEQQRSLVQTSPLSNTGGTKTIRCASRRTVRSL
jgi:hypothetical protein